MRENGYTSDGGVIYYAASKTRVQVPFDEVLCGRTHELIDSLRRTARDGCIPPPLEDSPKCPRCSLVGICLPDETRLLAEGSDLPEKSDGDASVRRLIPARDDTRPLYVQEHGAYVGLKGDVLQVRRRGDKKGKLAEVRLQELSQVSLFGNVQISTQALRRLCGLEIPVAYFSYGGWFNGLTLGLPSKNVELRQKQYALAADFDASLNFSRSFVSAKIENQRTMLRRNHVEPLSALLKEMKRLIERAAKCDTAASLLGMEGNAARAYFSNFNGMLKPRGNGKDAGNTSFTLDFEKRSRRPPTDPVNALLSYAYSLLTKDLTIACWIVGFDPFLGLFHQPRYGRPALALDLMEEFRAIIADSVVLTVINNGIVDSEDFLYRGPAVALKPEGRKRFLRAYERRMDSMVTHPLFGYRISYRRALEVQVRVLARALSGELPEYVPFTTR